MGAELDGFYAHTPATRDGETGSPNGASCLPTLAEVFEDGKWSLEQQEFMLWLAVPTRMRSPRTQKALARKLGMSRFVLSRWKHLPGFGDTVLALRREYMKSADLPRVLEAQLRKAIEDEDTPAARLLLDFGGAMPESDRSQRASGPQVIIITDTRRVPDAIDAIAD